MLTYGKFMMEILTKNKRLIDEETIEFEVGFSAIIERPLPQNSKDPERVTLRITIGSLSIRKTLLDLGASIILCLFPWSRGSVIWKYEL